MAHAKPFTSIVNSISYCRLSQFLSVLKFMNDHGWRSTAQVRRRERLLARMALQKTHSTSLYRPQRRRWPKLCRRLTCFVRARAARRRQAVR